MLSPSLKDIRVLDLSRVLAGPYCSMLLGDMGAEVIKVERPGKGDDTRAFGPPFIETESAYYMSFNRSKKSITLNFNTDEGKEVLYRLIEKSDILLENFRPGTLEKQGLGYDKVSALNPRIIYASISGFGHTGPEKYTPGYDLVIQGMSGLMSLTGDADNSPFKLGTSIGDILAGIYTFTGILLALIAREKSGKGQKVDVSMLDGLVSLLTYQAGIYFATGVSPFRKGNKHPTICPYETFKASDDYINIAIGNDKFWQIFCDVTGMEDLKNDPKFSSNPKRVEHRSELFDIIQNIISKRKSSEWLEIFNKNGIPAGPILSVEQILNHPQILARNMVEEVNHPLIGNIKLTGIPVKLSDNPGRISSPPPILGQHNEEVLIDLLNYSAEDIKEFKNKKII